MVHCVGAPVVSALAAGNGCPRSYARVDFPLAQFPACVLFLRFTSCAIPADLLTASMILEPL